MSFEVKGIKGMQQRIDRIVRQVPNEAEQALRIEAEVIMTKSKQGYVPVDLGPLRASGHVSDPERRGKDVEVTLSFGGAAAPYALAVHEHPGDYDPPSWEGKGTSFVKGDGNSEVVHFGPGERGPKYLERPLRAAVAGMAERIASKIEAGLAGLLLLVLLAHPAAAQVSGISVKAFGSSNWRESVASVAALPATGNATGHLRFARDVEALYWWDGNSWESLAATQGPTGPTGPQGATGATGAAGAAGADGNPRDLADEGTTLTRRPTLNMIGLPVSCVDNAGANRWDCTISAGAHSALSSLSADDHPQYVRGDGRPGGQSIVGSISGSVPLRLFGYAGAGGGVSVIFGESGTAWGVSGLTGTGMYSRRCTNADCTTSSLDMHLRAARFSATTSGGFEHFSILGGDTENAPTSPAGAVGGSGTCLSFGDSATVTFSSAWTSICRQAQGVVKWPASREIPQSAPPYACDATTRGTTYYDSGDDDFCDCAGAGWRSRGAGSCS